MENTKKKHPMLKGFILPLPESNTQLQGHVNPMRLPITYLMETMRKVAEQPVIRTQFQMCNN